jgi:uncharacterized protein
MRPIRQFAVLATVVLAITACNGGAPAASRPSEQPTSPATSASPAATSGPSTEPTKKRSAKPDAREQARLNEQLIKAAWDNDRRRARTLIAQGADVNAKDTTVQSAYLISTSEGYLEPWT